jgi:DNA polymerase I-like protein with 3'-5' exonuclease and polymerase domains
MILIELDLAGAEWVIVAYVSGDKNMIGVIESGKSPHIVTGSLITGVPEELVEAEHKVIGSLTDRDTIADLRKQIKGLLMDQYFLPSSMSIRQGGKKSNHGLNYNMQYKRFALENEIPENDALRIVHAYSHTAYPGLQDYWAMIRDCLRKDRTLVNLLGRKVRLLGEWGTELFDKAYSYIPQSTVAGISLDAMASVFEDQRPVMRPAQIMAQVHDSVVFQYPEGKHMDDDLLRIAQFIVHAKEHMSPVLKYGAHEFTLGVDAKVGRSWGEMTSIGRPKDVEGVAAKLRLFFDKESSAADQSPAAGPAASEVEALVSQIPDHPEMLVVGHTETSAQ